MRTAAVLPVKTFPRAKQRLGGAVEGPARHELAAAMVDDVLDALGRVAALEVVIVVTAEPAAAAAASRAGAVVVHDPHEAGQSAAAALGVAAAVERHAERVLLVPGDCPALDAAEMDAVLGAARPARSVVIVPDRHGSGTNALLLCPAGVIAPAFGAGSFARHAALAAAAGASVQVAGLPSLALDVDTPGDLAALREALGAHERGAARTRAVLGRLAAPAVA
jgi:2-phospho-L-lactate/phosphoenolpyruvate guanylyltransferase